ncbi:hypothetical protein [Mucilaginibacter sp. KACC 22063]|uniref:hypothetical protein n=1 Tax=Mucilaginibacter sp. KACC 22063 TaxID=3025666 RepID=UPI0023667D5D|nr:hypothetical protein [Mucilaginibacter sp. KACC 22063]WDF56190.1 hypothetical protein PQ461_03835 [Mucilaginibacter sp. KACC 22063]
MKAYVLISAILLATLTGCHENPNNKFGGPSNAKDTAASKRDTSSSSTRAGDYGK